MLNAAGGFINNLKMNFFGKLKVGKVGYKRWTFIRIPYLLFK